MTPQILMHPDFNGPDPYAYWTVIYNGRGEWQSASLSANRAEAMKQCRRVRRLWRREKAKRRARREATA